MRLDVELGLRDASFWESRLARARSRRLRSLEESLIRRELAAGFRPEVRPALSWLLERTLRVFRGSRREAG
jgi:hypothetical protein